MGRFGLGLLVGVVVMAAVPAGASAVVVQTGNGQRYGVFLRPGESVSALPGARVPTSGRVADSNGNVNYHTGPVLQSSAPYLIFWDPNGEITAKSQTVLKQYLTDTAADSGKGTDVFSVLSQYTDSSNDRADYKQTFSASQALVDNQPYPTTASGCTTASAYPHCVTDAQIQSELTRLISADSLPTGTGANAPIYFLITPKDTNVCGTGLGCAANGDFCAYHSAFADASNDVLYSPVPFMVWTVNSTKGCQVDGTAAYQSPSSDQADNIADDLSHELDETITDPLGNAWYNDDGGNEVADNCESYGASVDPIDGLNPDAYQPTLGGSEPAGTLYDQLINGDRYYTQTVWSNSSVGCEAQAVTPHFTDSVHGVAVSFDPTASTQSTGSIASVRWDFGDGASASSTGSPAAISHTYALPGTTYTVTLTLLDSFGNVSTLRQAITTNPLPTASFTGPTSGVTGTAVTFDGSGSSDPADSIVGYAWSFGDGATSASGPTTTHTYSAPGAYIVALTVTSSSGLPSTTSHQITIANPPPPATASSAGLGKVKVAGNTAAVTVSCKGAGACSVTLQMSVIETSRGGTVIAVTASKKTTKKTVIVGKVNISLAGGQTKTIQVSLNQAGRRLLARFHKLKVTLAVVSAGKTVSHTTVSFKAPPKKK